MRKPQAFETAVPVVTKTLAHAAREGIGEAHQLEQMITHEVGRWAHKKFRRSPLIIAIVVDA
jgi:ribonuclease J